MNVVTSFVCNEKLHQEMNKIVELGIFPSKNSIVKAGIQKVIDDVKAKENEKK